MPSLASFKSCKVLDDCLKSGGTSCSILAAALALIFEVEHLDHVGAESVTESAVSVKAVAGAIGQWSIRSPAFVRVV